MCLTPCCSIISWNISPPLSPTRLHCPLLAYIYLTSIQSNSTIDVRLVHLRLLHILQRVQFVLIRVLIERWTGYWSALPMFVDPQGQRPYNESLGPTTQLREENNLDGAIQVANSRCRSCSGTLIPLGSRRSIPVRRYRCLS
jgi:hypothetical protein